MASTFTAYDHLWKLCNYYGLNLSTATIKARIVTSSYTFSAAHTAWDNGANDATDPSYNEATNGDGYTTGGITLSNDTATNSKVDFDDITWTALTKTFRGIILVAVGEFGGVTDPVLGYLLPDSTPADIVSNGSNYSVLWNSTDGVFYRPA
jgi:hypothetical protein